MLDSLQDFGDESHKSSGSSVSGKVGEAFAPGAATRLPHDSATNGIVGEAFAPCAAPRIPPDNGNVVDAFAQSAAPRLPSASATSDLDGGGASTSVYGPHVSQASP